MTGEEASENDIRKRVFSIFLFLVLVLVSFLFPNTTVLVAVRQLSMSQILAAKERGLPVRGSCI